MSEGIMSEHIRNYLKNVDIFASADISKLEAHITDEAVRTECFLPGQIIFSPDSTEKCVGIIVSGTATAVPASVSDSSLLRLIKASDMFGIANLYSENDVFPSIIRAKTPAEVLFIKGNAFKSFLSADKNAMNAYLELLSKKIVYLNKKISTLTAGSTEKKLAVFLCENEDGGEFVSPVSLSALSEMLNVGRASLYRALDTLTEKGLIARSGKKIAIPDKNALLKFI